MAKGGTTALAALILSIVLFVFFTALGIYFYRQVEALPEGSGAGGLKYRLDEKKKELRTEKATLAEKEAKLAEVVIQLRLALEKYNMLETDVNRERKDGHIFGERTKTSTSQTRTAEVIKRKVTEEKEAQRTDLRRLAPPLTPPRRTTWTPTTRGSSPICARGSTSSPRTTTRRRTARSASRRSSAASGAFSTRTSLTSRTSSRGSRPAR